MKSDVHLYTKDLSQFIAILRNYLVHHLHLILILNNETEIKKKNSLINNASDLEASSFIIFSKKEKEGKKKTIEWLRFKSGKISAYGYKFVQLVNCLIKFGWK